MGCVWFVGSRGIEGRARGTGQGCHLSSPGGFVCTPGQLSSCLLFQKALINCISGANPEPEPGFGLPWCCSRAVPATRRAALGITASSSPGLFHIVQGLQPWHTLGVGRRWHRDSPSLHAPNPLQATVPEHRLSHQSTPVPQGSASVLSGV